MVSRDAVLAKARGWLDRREEPDGSNNVEFSRDWGIVGQSWCFAFVQSCFYYADPSPSGALPHQSMYCPYGIQWARDNGQAIEIGGSPAPGDIAFFTWDTVNWPRNRPGTGDHVGIVTGWDGGDTITTIEGNIGSPQGVWEKNRSISQTVVCFWRPTVFDDDTFGVAAIPEEEDMTPEQVNAQNETLELVRWLKAHLLASDLGALPLLRNIFNRGEWTGTAVDANTERLLEAVKSLPAGGGTAGRVVDVEASLKQATAAQLIAALTAVLSAGRPAVDAVMMPQPQSTPAPPKPAA